MLYCRKYILVNDVEQVPMKATGTHLYLPLPLFGLLVWRYWIDTRRYVERTHACAYVTAGSDCRRKMSDKLVEIFLYTYVFKEKSGFQHRKNIELVIGFPISQVFRFDLNTSINST